MADREDIRSDFHDRDEPGSQRQIFHHIDKRVKEKHPALLNLIERVRNQAESRENTDSGSGNEKESDSVDPNCVDERSDDETGVGEVTERPTNAAQQLYYRLRNQ